MSRKILTFFVLFVFLVTYYSNADEIDNEEINFNSIETSANTSEIPKINSNFALVLERKTNTVLFEKNGYSQTAMASTTKIMTAIIAIENSNLSDIVSISRKAANTGGSTLRNKRKFKIKYGNSIIRITFKVWK